MVHTLPLEVYAFLASFLEEVIAPIPSSAVLLSIGSIASVQDYETGGLIPLLLISTVGKTLGAILIYYCAHRFGAVLITKYGKFFGVSAAALANFATRLENSRYIYVTITLLRALPIVPSALLSIGCGILKIDFRLFVVATIIGTLIRDALFIYVGFKGTDWLRILTQESSHLVSTIQTTSLVLLVSGVLYVLYRKTRN